MSTALMLALLAAALPVPSGTGRELLLAESTTPGQRQALAAAGIDILGGIDDGRQGISLLLYSNGEEIAAAHPGPFRLVRPARVRRQTRADFAVYTDFDAAGGIRDRVAALAAAHPTLFATETIGRSRHDREIPALRFRPDGFSQPPAARVLVVGGHHAREWISVELVMRLAARLAAGPDAAPAGVEVWLAPVLNPDGYQYSFDADRNWRKNLHDSNGNGRIDAEDGVDLNRNYDAAWGVDDLGSSPERRSPVYRGPDPFSEPESRAIRDLVARVRFSVALSYHSFGNLILFPWNWSSGRLTPDDPYFRYAAGSEENPAIVDTTGDSPSGYRPIPGHELYLSNGEFADWMYLRGVPAFTVELTAGFLFDYPDDERLVARTVDDNWPFLLDLLRLAADHRAPVRTGLSLETLRHEPLAHAYGDRAAIRLLAERGPEPPAVRYRDGSGAIRPARPSVLTAGIHFDEWQAWLPLAGGGVAYAVGDPPDRFIEVDRSGSGPAGVLILALDEAARQTAERLAEGSAAPGTAARMRPWNAERLGVQAQELAPFRGVVAIGGPAGSGSLLTRPDLFALRDFAERGGRLALTGDDLLATVFETGQARDLALHLFGIGGAVPDGAFDGVSGNPVGIVIPSDSPLAGPFPDGIELDLAARPEMLLPAGGTVAAGYRELPVFGLRDGPCLTTPEGRWILSRLMREVELPAGRPALFAFNLLQQMPGPARSVLAVELGDPESGTNVTLPETGGATVRWKAGMPEAKPFLDVHPDLADRAGTPEGLHLLTGSRPWWRRVAFDLSAWAGRRVSIGLLFATTDPTTGEEWTRVDDIELAGEIEDGGSLAGWQIENVSWGERQLPPVNDWRVFSGPGTPAAAAVSTGNTLCIAFPPSDLPDQHGQPLFDGIVRFAAGPDDPSGGCGTAGPALAMMLLAAAALAGRGRNGR